MFNKIEIGKILLTVGILFLLLEVISLYFWDVFSGMLFIGWLLTISGAVLTSLRASAWTFFLMGLYLWFISFSSKISEGNGSEIHLGFLPLLIVIPHILFGLIMAIISFLESKKRKE